MKEPSWWLCLLAYINYGNARRRLGAIYGWQTRKFKRPTPTPDDMGRGGRSTSGSRPLASSGSGGS